jgi:hypothetical protein
MRTRWTSFLENEMEGLLAGDTEVGQEGGQGEEESSSLHENTKKGFYVANSAVEGNKIVKYNGDHVNSYKAKTDREAIAKARKELEKQGVDTSAETHFTQNQLRYDEENNYLGGRYERVPIDEKDAELLIPELDTRDADFLTAKYSGRYISEGGELEGILHRVRYITGSRQFSLILTDGQEFPATPEQIRDILVDATEPTPEQLQAEEDRKAELARAEAEAKGPQQADLFGSPTTTLSGEKVGEAIPVTTYNGIKTTGKRVILKGLEGMDTVVINDGLNHQVIELATGKKIGEASADFAEPLSMANAERAAILQAEEVIAKRGVTADLLFEKMYNQEKNAIGMQRNPIVNHSPAYEAFKQAKETQRANAPYVISDPKERAGFEELLRQADEEGLETLYDIIQKQLEVRSVTGKEMKADLDFMRQQLDRARAKLYEKTRQANRQPLPEENKDKVDTDETAFKKWINALAKSDKYEKVFRTMVPEHTQEQIFKAFEKKGELYNKYGYTPYWMDTDLFTAVQRYMVSLNAKSEEGKAERIDEDRRTLEAEIYNIDYWHARELFEPKQLEDFKAKINSEELAKLNEADQLSQMVKAGLNVFSQRDQKAEPWRSAAWTAVTVENFQDNKYPNGERLNIPTEMGRIDHELEILRDAAQRIASIKENRYRKLPDVTDGLSPITAFENGDLVVDATNNTIYQVGGTREGYGRPSREIKNVQDGTQWLADLDALKFRTLTAEEVEGLGDLGDPMRRLPKDVHPSVRELLTQVKGMDDPRDRQAAIDTYIYGLAGDSRKNLRQEIYTSLKGRQQPKSKSTLTNIKSELLKYLPNASSTTGDLESDRTRRGPENTVRSTVIPHVGSRGNLDTSGDGGDVIQADPGPTDSPGLLPFDATTTGKPGDSGIHSEEPGGPAAAEPSGPSDSGGSRASDEGGISPDEEPVFDTEGTIREESDGDIEHKIEAQKAARDLPHVPMDIANIRASLPVLTKEQQEDVLAAEKRFFGDSEKEEKLYGKAILFTNGTGTGKTFTGLGIAQRFLQQGKGDILILVPSDAKAKDWIAEAGQFFDLPVYQLADTKDSGRGIRVTTYANFRDNQNLQTSPMDLVLYDESHKLNSNEGGETTAAEQAHKALTLSPRMARAQAEKNINFDARQRAIMQGDLSREKLRDLEKERDAETVKVYKRTKVVFLSATPFAYHKSLEYADGYLFCMNEEFAPTYNNDSYKNFFIQHFGYRIRYNKLTAPESGVDVDLLERQFTEGLKKDGYVVSRKLKLDQDYSRQFVLVHDGIGNTIDEGLAIARDYERYPGLYEVVQKKFDWLYSNRLLEAIKAKWAVDRIRQHLALGRKVVVFHSYNEGLPSHPFYLDDPEIMEKFDPDKRRKLAGVIQKFYDENPQYRNLQLTGLRNPIETLRETFPDQAVFFNGRVSKRDRTDAKKNFNKDGSGKNLIVVQIDAGQEGLSLHDKTGKHQRVMMNLGLPIKPTSAIQSEGRIYRTGQRTNAVIEYPVLHLNFERFMFAGKINSRARTAENFALGEDSRNLETAYKEGYINATDVPVSHEQGTGGKLDDARMDETNEFDKARTYYYKRGKRTAQDKRNVDGDYYATPEPVGMKMAEWLNLAPNEKGLEPSAGHGAIARFFPGNTSNTFIEPNTNLRSEVALNAKGETRGGTFEDLNIINKYDGIAMNPPFGTAGKLAMDHLRKAMGHLRDGGRIVALVPTGKMNDRIQQWQESEEANNFHIRARIQLPAVTFERAGTKVSTQILVIDKITNPEVAEKIMPARQMDLSYIDNIKDLFDQVEDLSMPERVEVGKYAAPAGEKAEDDNQERPTTTSSGVPLPSQGSAASAPAEKISEVVKAWHSKEQRDSYVVKLNKYVSGEEFKQIAEVAKKLGGYWSTFKGNGAIPGFQFKDEATANKMQSALTGDWHPEAPQRSLADRIRTWKLAKDNGALNSMIIPIPQLWNAAVETVARLVEGGTALADALRKGIDHIDKNYKEKWDKHLYNQQMIGELKARGVLDYQLSPEQKAEADKIIRRLAKNPGKLIEEVNRIKEIYDRARSQMTDPADIQELDDSYREMQGYLFGNMAIHEAEKTDAVDLQLKKQTWWQKQKENWAYTHERMHRTQQAITKAGITIDEKNDMVNIADRWKAIAQAKINEVLHRVGLADVDVFVWQGMKKVANSLFDQMAKAGVDFREFNLYLYALHAPERNAHNAKIRREALQTRIEHLEGEIAAKEADYALVPSSTLKGLVTRLKNEHQLLTTYQDLYGDPTADRNYLRLVERKVEPQLRLMDDGGSGMTNQQASEILDEVRNSGQQDKFDAFEKEIRTQLIEKTLELQKQYGLIDEDNYDFMSQYYQHYVPLRVDDSNFEEALSFSKTSKSGAQIFKSKGADFLDFERRVNPVTQAVINLQRTIYAGEQNNFSKTVAAAIRSAPDSKVWELQSAMYQPIRGRDGRLKGMQEVSQPDERKSIPYFDGGQKKYLIINDEALAKELKGENVIQSGPILSKFASINSFFRQLFTVYNPAFTATNFFRDAQTAGAILGSKYGGQATVEFHKNLAQITRIVRGSYKEQSSSDGGYWTERAKQYTELGGNMSWLTLGDNKAIIEDIEDTYKKYQKNNSFETGKQLALRCAEFFNRANQSVETGTRLAIFDAMLKTGMEPHKAVEVARNATINFNRKGNYGGAANSLYLFFNAGIQGSANMLSAIMASKRGKAIALGMVGMGVLQSVLNNWLSDCSGGDPGDCYDNIPDYEKERSIIIPKPGKGFIKIPLAYGFNFLWNLGEQLGQLGQGKQTVLGASTMAFKTMLNAFNPMGGADTPLLQQLSPTATDPLVQYLTNQDSMGRKIYQDNSFDHRPDSERSFASTSETSKHFAQWLNRQSGGNEKLKGKIDVSPGTLDFLISTVTGGTGQFLRQTAVTISDAADSQKDVELKNVPILNRFFTLPHEKSDRGLIYDGLNDSYNRVMTPEERTHWEAELQRAQRLGEIAPEKAQGYQRTVGKNQLQLSNPQIFSILDVSKQRPLSEEEVEGFLDKLEPLVESGQLTDRQVQAYKAVISKNQKKFRDKDEDE